MNAPSSLLSNQDPLYACRFPVKLSMLTRGVPAAHLSGI